MAVPKKFIELDAAIALAGTDVFAIRQDRTRQVALSAVATYLNSSSILTTFAPKASPALSGTPTAPTATTGTNTTQVATTAFVQAAISALIAAAPGALDTLNELAASLGNDANFAATMTTALAGKVAKSGDTLSGKLTTSTGSTAGASLNVPAASAAPTSPVNGDIWGDSTLGIRHRVNGVTYSYGRIEGANTWGAKNTFVTPTTSTASINLPHGVAPSAPVDGDFYTTAAGGLYGRINGTIYQFFTYAGGTYTGKVTFLVGNTTNAGVNVPAASAAPTSPVNGDLWGDPTTGHLKYRILGATFTHSLLEKAQTWTAPQRVASTVLTSGATITPNFGLTNDFTLTLTTNAALANPTGLTVGQKGSIIITQDGTGGRTLSYGSQYKWEDGTPPDLSTAANAVDRLDYHVVSASAIHCKLSTGYA